MTAVYPAGVTRITGEQLSLSTSIASLGFPGIEVKQAIIYVPSTNFRLHINPAIREVLYYDASNAAGTRYEKAGATSTLTTDLTDRSATGTGTAMDSGATGDRLYICFADIVGGFRIDMTASVNGAASGTMTVNYWNGAWTDSSATDGSNDGTRTLAQDGNVTFTTPTDWLAAHLGGSNVDNMSITDADATGTYGLWVQITWSTALDSDTEIANIWALNRDTSRGYFRAGQDYHFSFDRRIVQSLEAILAAGTDTMDITWVRTVV